MTDAIDTARRPGLPPWMFDTHSATGLDELRVYQSEEHHKLDTLADRSSYLFYFAVLIFLLHILYGSARCVISGVRALGPLQEVHQPFDMLGYLSQESVSALV